MSPPPGFVVRGCRRAFLAAGNREVTTAELFAWCYARRTRHKRVRLSARHGDETFLDRRNAYRTIRRAAVKMAIRVGRVWPGGNVWWTIVLQSELWRWGKSWKNRQSASQHQ